MRREHKYTVKHAKASSWRDFTSNTHNTSTMAKLNKIIHHQQNRHCIGLLKRPNSPDHTQNIKETLQVLMSEHFPDSTEATETNIPPSNSNPPNDYPWINETLFHKAVNRFGLDKAPGTDGFKPIILQKLNTKAIKRLLKIIRHA